MKNGKTINGMDRRDFLKAGAVAGAGLAFASHTIARAAEESAPKDINVALLGAGDQGQILLSCGLKAPGVHYRAVCDIWTDYSLAQTSRTLTEFKYEHNTYTDYKEMLAKEKDLDAVLIATPDFCHTEQAVACLKAGLHVYCESPISNTLDGARQMVKAARENGKVLQIGHQRRSNPRYQHCGNALLGEVKLLGRINAAQAQWNREVQPDRGFPRRAVIDDATLKKYGYTSMEQFRNWRWYRAMGGGPLASLGTHQIDVFNWFLGAWPTAVIASAGTDYYDKETHQWPDTVLAALEYETPKGMVRAAYQNINTNSNLGSFEKFLGDQGAMLLSEAVGMANVYPEATARDWDRWVNLEYLSRPPGKEKKEEGPGVISVTESVGPEHYTIPVKFDDPNHKPHVQNFFAAVRGEEAPNCPGDQALAATLAITKIIESAETGKRIEINPEEYGV